MDPENSALLIGDVVSSTAGRDQGCLFYVICTEDQYVTLVNGRNRPLEKPKRKKRKHVVKVLRSETRFAGSYAPATKCSTENYEETWLP